MTHPNAYNEDCHQVPGDMAGRKSSPYFKPLAPRIGATEDVWGNRGARCPARPSVHYNCTALGQLL